MKVSKFNIIIPSPENPYEQLLYNTLYDHQLLITDSSYRLVDLFEKIDKGESLSAEEKEGALQLKELGIIVDDYTDEVAEFEWWFKEKIQDSKNLLTATILTTLDCNLRCKYCLEKDVLTHIKMENETADKVITWLSSRISEIHPNKVHLEFFGGEPLLNTEVILRISGMIRDVCNLLKIEYSAGVATNGVLLTTEVADKLVAAGLNRIKVTLDGDEAAHDQKRIYADGRGTFDKIFKNLEDNAGKFKIMIGGNFDQENIDRIPNLINILKESKFRNDIVHVTFKPIIKDFGNKAHDTTDNCEISSFSDDDINTMFRLRELIKAAGLPTFDQIALGPCEFYRRNSVTINVDGGIFNCPALVGRNSFAAGSVFNNKPSSEGERQLSLKPWRDKDECGNCPYLPICGGGCRATAWNDSGKLTTVSCDRRFFDMMVKKVIAKQSFASGPAE